MNSLLCEFYILLAQDPMDILSQGSYRDTQFEKMLGIQDLYWSIQLAGILSAAIVLIASGIMLYVVSYQKSVAQIKEKIVSVLISVISLASLPFIFDIALTILYEVFNLS